MRTADVVVIGAGIVGLSVAHHLLDQSRLKLIVIDRAKYPGAGATGRATGGIRHQFSSATLIRMTQVSMEEYMSFNERVGVGIEFEPIGYLFVTGSEDQLKNLRRSKELQNRFRVPTELLTVGEINDRFPFMVCDDLVGGTFCGIDGAADPHAAVTGYARSIRSGGGELALSEEVVGIDVSNSQVRGVRTNREFYASPIVVNAAGAHAANIGMMVGVRIPVAPFLRQITVLSGGLPASKSVPFLVDLDTGWYLHRLRDGTILLGGTDRDTRAGDAEVVDMATTELQVEIGVRRVHGLQQARLLRSYVGIRPLTADDHPVLGPVPELRGFYCACGTGGHGFMHAPAIGKMLAQWILEGQLDEFDADAISVLRFRRQNVHAESMIF